MYQKMYLILFNALTDAIEKIERKDLEGAIERLKSAQQQAEECYIEWED